MYIHLTEAAQHQLAPYSLSGADRIRLVYDSEGCGCAVSGVASLWLTNTTENDETLAETNAPSLTFSYLKRHEIFFEDRLNLDYNPERRAFRLSSNGQIYGSGILVSDRRGVRQAHQGGPR
jgi:uncharacterized protein YqkB